MGLNDINKYYYIRAGIANIILCLRQNTEEWCFTKIRKQKLEKSRENCVNGKGYLRLTRRYTLFQL